jgi:CDP-glycerol glycerophosphotransferase (TagB/SpsB family)
MIISDYSSYVIEATLADKPLYIYAYDLDDYEANTGLNIDFRSEPIASYVFGSAGELAESLSKEYDMSLLRAFRDRYIDIDTENCTRDLADFIETLIQK